MSRTLTLTILCILLIAVVGIPGRQGMAQVELAATQVLAKDILPPGGKDTIKHPSIAGFQNTVHLAANPSEEASYWSKNDAATSWSARTSLGVAPGQADYTTAAVTVGPDGSVYVVWIDRDAERINLRRTTPGAGFGNRITVAPSSNFAVFPKVGVAANGQVFVAWNADKRMRYAVSSDGGNTWSARRTLGPSKEVTGLPYIATDASGNVLIAHYAEGNIYANIWNGSDFASVTVADNNEYFSDPSAAITPDGRFYVAWRSHDSAWYSERQSDGSWPIARLATAGDGKSVSGKVAVAADAGNNVYIFWLSNRSGRTEAYAAYKAVGKDWEGPTMIDVDGGFPANIDGAATLSGANSYGHITYEFFEDDDVSVRYALVASPAGNVRPGGRILINDDAASTTSRTVNVKIEVTTGEADQYKFSNDKTTFSTYATIPTGNVAAWELENGTSNACVQRTVYGHIRKSDQTEQESDMMSDAILLDPGVDAQFSVRNPYLASNPSVLSTSPILNDTQVEGARDGDPRYTRVKGYFLVLQGLVGECSGLSQLTIDGQTITITDNTYSTVRALPDFETPAENVTAATVRDAAGHTTSYESTIYYDDTAPNVTSGSLQIVDSANTAVDATDSIQVNLNFASLAVTDNLYGQQGEARPFWGVWIANSRTDLDPDSDSAMANLTWVPLEVTNATSAGTNSYTFTVPWSLFSGLPRSQHTSGAFYIYARVLDGAGNWSDRTLEYEVTLNENFEWIEIQLPLTAK